MSGPKIAVIGAGSYFFGREIIYKAASSPVLNNGTLALVDIDKKVLKTMKQLAVRVLAKSKNTVKITADTDYKKAVKSADFVVLTFSWQNAHYRGIDTEIAQKHGIRMCSSDTIGPGGVFRAMREIPKAVEIARYTARVSPSAWVINFINPTAVLGMALRSYAPEIRSFALCDGLHEPRCTLRYLQMAGMLPFDANEIPAEVWAGLDLKITGVNHCTWVIRFNYKGKNMLPALRNFLVKKVREEKKNNSDKAKGRFNRAYTLKLLDIYGAYPNQIGHTKEYVPFFQGYGNAPVKPEPIICFNANRRAEEMAQAWEITEKYASGKLSVPHFMKNTKSDHASDIIESMWGNLRKPFYVNTSNNGAVPNMPDDAFLELRSDLDLQGARPQPACDMPRGILALQHQVLDTHELTAQAAMTGDKKVLRRAMLTDPICNNIEDADACIKDLLAAQKEALPRYWY